MGALVVKQAVYVLPDSPGAREDFEWLKEEIEGAGGQASVFSGDSVDGRSDEAMVEEFRRARQTDYARLAREVEGLLRRIDRRAGRKKTLAPGSHRALGAFRQRFVAIERVDFFSSAGRDRVSTLLERVNERVAGRPRPAAAATERADTNTYRGRLWVTRPRPGVDRMASAWLLRRFVDPDARFEFVGDRDAAPASAIPFDMFGVEFSHQGEHCTFETLCEVFGIHDVAVGRVAAVVHDLDLKDAHFGAPETATVGAVIEGLQLAHADDHALLAHGVALFEALYKSFEQSTRSAGPRALARPRKASAGRRRSATRVPKHKR